MEPIDINPEWAQTLADGVIELGLAVSEEQQALLLRYIALLHKWNRAFNLTAVRDPREMITRHLLDSLSIAPLLRGDSILDVGTGPGLPGIPLAILFPARQFTLLDSNGKKTRFVRQAAMELGLGNVHVEQARVESFDLAQGFDCILSRAFASLPEMVGVTRHLLAPGGVLLAMKGQAPQQELAGLEEGLTAEVVSLRVPGLNEARHAVIISLSA